jgi:uncharacterized protein (DUF1800 family)
VLATIFSGPEFRDPQYFGAKPKTPLELVASTLRAVAAEPTNWAGAVSSVSAMGMPLYFCIPPTGYSNDGREWMNASSLLNRINFSFDLVSGSTRGLNPRLDVLLGDASRSDPTAVAGRVAEQIFGYRLSQTTWQAATRPPASAVPVAVRVVSLMLGSPEFQWR